MTQTTHDHERDYAPAIDAWGLDRSIAFLNHGSFGACPTAVLEAQSQWRRRLERNPVQFLVNELDGLIDRSRAAVGRLVGADPGNLVFVSNATSAVNAVLRSLSFEPGDEILMTDHTYNACANVVRHVALRQQLHIAVARVPFPLTSEEQAVAAILDAATPRTRIALIDHITSPTAIVLPIKRIVGELASRGIETLVDGAHAPGMIPLDINDINAAYYTGNCHKWLCAPKGVGFLHVRADQREAIVPTIISHGMNRPRDSYNRFQDAFDWPGTADPTAMICLPEAIAFLESRIDGGLPELMRHNHDLAVRARDILCAALGATPPCPDALLGAMATVALPDDPDARASDTSRELTPTYHEALKRRLYDEFAIEVPIVPWPHAPSRWVRISAQLYNTPAQYERLATALLTCVGRFGK